VELMTENKKENRVTIQVMAAINRKKQTIFLLIQKGTCYSRDIRSDVPLNEQINSVFENLWV
jgi:hypothetical protein